MKGQKKTALEQAPAKKPETAGKSPYMSKGIYHNYEKGMKERNHKRKVQGLQAIPVRTYEEWSSV